MIFFLTKVQVRKVEDEGELPGLMIEEMMESASVVRDIATIYC